MKSENYRDKLESFLIKEFSPAGYILTKNVELDLVKESFKYHALTFKLNDKSVIYRKGKVTEDRPGAFLAIWKRPPISNTDCNKPIPFKYYELDYLFIKVDEQSHDPDTVETRHKLKSGLFIFPTSLLIKKGIISSEKAKGKTGFRVFPPWSGNRGTIKTKVFSDSGKRTQSWQLPYFVKINNNKIDIIQLHKILHN